MTRNFGVVAPALLTFGLMAYACTSGEVVEGPLTGTAGTSNTGAGAGPGTAGTTGSGAGPGSLRHNGLRRPRRHHRRRRRPRRHHRQRRPRRHHRNRRHRRHFRHHGQRRPRRHHRNRRHRRNRRYHRRWRHRHRAPPRQLPAVVLRLVERLRPDADQLALLVRLPVHTYADSFGTTVMPTPMTAFTTNMLEADGKHRRGRRDRITPTQASASVSARPPAARHLSW